MNGGSSDSDDDSAGMAYFLPIGIADDSPPKRSMAPAGSFGPIGGRTPTAGMSGSGGSFHRSNSPPSFLHMSSPLSTTSSSSPSVATPSLSPAAIGAGGGGNSNCNTTSNNFLLSDLGGEIHEPRLANAFSTLSDASSPASMSPFGGFASSFFNHASAHHSNSANSNSSTTIGGAPTAGSFFSPRSSDLASPFMTSAHETSRLNAAASNWPAPSVAATTATAAALPTTTPRRVFQPPPGLDGPTMSSPRLALGGSSASSDYLQQSRLLSAVGGVGSGISAFNGTYAAAAAPAAASDAFRSSSNTTSSRHPFTSSLSASSLPSLHLAPDVFANSSSNNATTTGSIIRTPQLLATDGHARGMIITNPDLAELNSHSIKMQQPLDDDVRSRSTTTLHESLLANAAATRETPPLRSASPLVAAGAQQRPQSVKRFEKQRSLDASPQSKSSSSPSSYRDVSAVPASANRPSRSPSATTMSKLSSVASPPPMTTAAAALRSAPAATSTDAKSTRAKKRTPASATAHAANSSSSNRSNRAASTSAGVTTPTGGVDADYESSDSTDVGVTSDAWESPIKATHDTRRGQKTDKSDKSTARGAKKSTAARSTQEKPLAPAPQTTARRQVYREKQQPSSRESSSPRSATKPIQLQPSHESTQSSDERESTTTAHQPSHKSEVRDAKPRTRRTKDATQAVAAAAALTLSFETKSAAAAGAAQASEQVDASDDGDQLAKAKRSPKQQNKAKASVNTSSSSAATSAASAAPATEAVSDEGAANETRMRDERSADAAAAAATAASSLTELSGDEKLPATTSSARGKRNVASPPSGEISLTEPLSPSSSSSSSTKKQPATAATPSAPPPPPAPLRKDKSVSKREKAEKKKSKQQKKDKALPRTKGESVDVLDIADLDASLLAPPASATGRFSARDVAAKLSTTVKATARTVSTRVRVVINAVSTRLNTKGAVTTGLYHLESFAAVAFSVVLLLSLHGASWFIRIHRVAFRAILTHRHIGFCFAFLYAFPFLVQYVFPWAPPWAPVCLWYAFLVQLFCTNGPTAMVTTFRIILPLVFLVEGISHHSFLLDLNGAELLLTSFIISAMKTSNLCSPIFFISLAAQCLSAVFLGSELIVQWFQMALALYSLHSMVVSEDPWNNYDDDDDREIICQPLHHSIADYNHHPSPAVVGTQKSKRFDRRALAYVRGRKIR